MKSIVNAKTILGIGIPVMVALCPPLLAQNNEASRNIALGKTVTVSPIPNYNDTPNKPQDLTDGNPEIPRVNREGTSALWVQPGVVGWAAVLPACIVVDLEAVRPISGFSYHTAAGISDVTWPKNIFVAVSDDQKTWKYVGDLITLSEKRTPTPPVDAPRVASPQHGYKEFTFATRDVKAKGRYVAFGVTSFHYIFTNEVEVYAGDESWLSEPESAFQAIEYPGQPGSSLEYIRALVVKQKQAERAALDATAIRELIGQSSVGAGSKTALLQKLTAYENVGDSSALPGKDYKAIMPVSDKHSQILSIHGALLADQGFAPLTAWTGHRYAWLPMLAKPPKGEKPELGFSMLRNQFRSQALLLTNASSAPQSVTLKLNNAPRGAQQGWLKVDAVQWTDTHQGVAVPDALLLAENQNGTYTLSVPAGMTRKVWLTVDSSKVPGGKTRSSIVLDNGQQKVSVPVSFDISTLAMNRPRISLGMWDDADSAERGGALGITMKNRDAALKLMQSHYVDTAWGKRPTLPWPEAKDFDATGNLTATLDFSRFDKWLKSWPEGRHFFNFIYADHVFADARMGTPEFNARVGSWAKALAAHMTSLGMQPKQLGILIIDEQRTEEHDAIVAGWARAIKDGAPELTIFQNPIWLRPDLIKQPDAIMLADTLSPLLQQYYRGGEPVKQFFEKLRQQGRELWFYQCIGPVRLFDPQRYYRYQAWHVYSIGGMGQGFWSFGDTGIAPTSWNEYLNTYFSYTPAFIDTDTVNNSVHWDSVREGMEDFEELAMLQDAIKASKNTKLRAEAQAVLDHAVKTVTGVFKDLPENADYTWQRDDIDPALADEQLKQVRTMLHKLRA
jgi:protein-disulfide isomerase